MGRKLFSKLSHVALHPSRRPLVPAGVGVPLMLTYVYGVVPMSLCRNGWCRQQAEPPDAHRIQLEDLASCEYRRAV